MIVIEPSYKIITPISEGGIEEIRRIEAAARVCYQSQAKMDEDGESAKKLIASMLKRGHESPLEHSLLTVTFICDRAIANELVRHRIAAFSQESTRYVNYAGNDDQALGLKFIKPLWLDEHTYKYYIWKQFCEKCEDAYIDMIDSGYSPEEARVVLPLCTKTELTMSANYREWRHILKLRTATSAHPQMRELMIPLLNELKEKIPVVFDYIEVD